MAARGCAAAGNESYNDLYSVWVEAEAAPDALFALAYDDIRSLIYFGRELSAYWNKNGKTITEAIEEALGEYNSLYCALQGNCPLYGYCPGLCRHCLPAGRKPRRQLPTGFCWSPVWLKTTKISNSS